MMWGEAKDAAAAMSYEGLQGHLATFTSADEWAFYVTNLGTAKAWLGGFQPAGSTEPDGNWQWVTGETWEYTACGGVGPDNTDNEENALVTWIDIYRGDALGLERSLRGREVRSLYQPVEHGRGVRE